MGVSIWGAVHLLSIDRWALSGANVQAPMARHARDSVAPLRRSSAGWMPAKIGRLSAGLGCRYPVTIRKVSFIEGSVRRVWGLQYQAGTQCSAVECTKAKVAVRRVDALTPQPQPTSRLRSATQDVNFLRSDLKFRRCVSDLSNVTPRYLGSGQKGRIWVL